MLVLKYGFFAWVILMSLGLGSDRRKDPLATFLLNGSVIVTLILVTANFYDDFFSTRTPWLDVRRGASCRGLKIDGSPRQRKPGLL